MSCPIACGAERDNYSFTRLFKDKKTSSVMELVFVGVNMLFLLDKSDLCNSKAVFSRCFESEFFGRQLVDSRNGECAHERCKTTAEFKRDIGK